VILKTALTLPTIALLLDGPMAKSQDTETLGARIARLRREKGLTQAELAQRLQVSQPVVSDYENDVIRLPADVVVQIAEILGASTDELLGMKAQAARSDSGIKNRRLYRRMQEIEKLPRRDQEALLRTIEAFISKTS
jgi:transcriptional regulator with XRE-family HTH domain